MNCEQCDECRQVAKLGLCIPCYDAARALGYSDAAIEELIPPAWVTRRERMANWTGPDLED